VLPLIFVAVAAAAAAGVAPGCGSGDVVKPPGPYPRPDYQLLAETGLFQDPATLTVTPDAVTFEPTYRLWSDGAAKRRWVRIPRGARIDSADMDHWVFPIGTKFWKEFSVDGTLLETRLVERYGEGPDDYWMGSFVWNPEQTEATLAPDGQVDVNGSTHDAPSQEQCGACHRGDVGRVLGLSALQMSRAAGGPQLGPTIADLTARGMLTVPPPVESAPYAVPGDPVAVAALGYLHANCGHCHNENGTAWPDTQMVLRLGTGDRDVETSAVYQSIVGHPLQYWRGGAITSRVVAGAPDASAIVARMSVRGTDDQMPPLATEQIDPAGVEAVRTWIQSLGAPAPPVP
jgi:mono/diheme cytochrome c family protein